MVKIHFLAGQFLQPADGAEQAGTLFRINRLVVSGGPP